MLAQEAASQLGLERVLLVPTGEAPHKRIEPEPGPEVRLELARLAAEGDELLEVSDLEVARDGPSYTVPYAWSCCSEQHPGDELDFLMGADMAAADRALAASRERVLELARLGDRRRARDGARRG